MKNTLFQLMFLLLLGLSEAVPITRTESLTQDPKVLDLAGGNIHNLKVISGRKWHLVEATIGERMDIELHDYPPSGANGRHTPKPPYP
ncbi:hypothetical protein DEO72_LG11g924 [Vigna unguiculata]|uniref:Cupredoxin n=1 Tax=Vigna unguiculata TaxID=3917 RepID=A0A4D6NJT2_VIGUN|nr:hypothetical protein DEO72_LG11g924 [Vigna unguiculata]